MSAVGYIYKTTNLINGRIYIGQKISKEYDAQYFGSGSLIRRDIYLNGVDNFKNEILEWCNTIDELNEKDVYWIQHYNSTDLNIGYNIQRGGLNDKHSKTTKDKISSKMKEIKNKEKDKQYNDKIMQKQSESIKNRIKVDMNKRKLNFFNNSLTI